MISFHNILSIAKYERKTLLRSWFFRIFGILSLLVLFGMNFGMVIQGGGGDGWAIRAIPGAIPYFNLLMLNVAQAIIAVFLASDFLKRDKKLDTTEVIYMRSMTNGEYVIGNTWGNLQVFLVLNIAVVIMALIFNLLTKNTNVDWMSYVVYLVTISVPTLVFIMGLSFLLMSVIRNQAITFVLILGYIGITLFLVQAKFYYLFDYMAFNIPMLSSDMVGFGNLETILIHRGIYFFLGLGFIFATIFLLKRLPQSEGMTIFSLIFSLVFIAGGSYLAYLHIHNFKLDEQLRAEALALNNQYVAQPVPVILAQKLEVQHQGDTLAATVELSLRNETGETLQQLIFSLNNGLKIHHLKLNGADAPFVRKKHLFMVNDGVNIAPGEEAKMEINYSGKVDERLCYLDIDEKTIQEKYGNFVINVDKRYAFCTPDYVLLTPEVNWYPKAGVTYSSENVGWYQPHFMQFDLTVKTRPGLQAISQGEPKELSAGTFTFQNQHPLTAITLAIGNYTQLVAKTEKVDFGLWHMEGHDYFREAFPESKDTIPAIIAERFGDFQRTYNLGYASQRLMLVEVPAQFKTYPRSWSSRQESVQPGQVLIPEKAFMLREADFENQKKRIQRWGRGNENSTPLDLEIRVLNEFINIFTTEINRTWRGGRGGMSTTVETANPYFIFPLLYNFQNNIQSDQWPITNRIFEAYLKSQVTDMRSVFMSNMQGQSNEERANIALQDSTFEQILADPKQKTIIESVIKLKGDDLFSMIEWKAGQSEFQDFLQKMLAEYRFRNISFEVFAQNIKDQFGLELIPLMDNWFKAKTLPGYLFSPVKAVKVKSGDRMRTLITMKATNFSDTEGLVKLSFRLGGGPGGGRGRGPGGGSSDMINKLVFLEAHQTKELSYLLDTDPRMVIINTMTSQNIPQTMMEFFRDIPEDPKAVPQENETVTEIPVQLSLPNEIIVDNEDPGFSVEKNENMSLLEKWIIKKEAGGSKYSGMNFWRPPANWTMVTNSDFYGEVVRSAYYIKGGDGSLKAKWSLPLKQPGYYDVYFHFYQARWGRRGGGNEKGEYHFTIHTDDGAEEALLAAQNAEPGWVHLGTYYFTADTAIVELSNKTELRMIFADAVKLVEQ